MAWHTTLAIGDLARQVGLTVDGPAAVRADWTDAEMTKVENVWGQQFPRGIVLNFLMLHQAHHRGQMTVLMRQAGLTIPGVYGPSKEEWASFGAPAPAV